MYIFYANFKVLVTIFLIKSTEKLQNGDSILANQLRELGHHYLLKDDVIFLFKNII